MDTCYVLQYATFDTRTGKMIGRPHWVEQDKLVVMRVHGEHAIEAPFLVPYAYGTDYSGGDDHTAPVPTPVDPKLLERALRDFKLPKTEIIHGSLNLVVKKKMTTPSEVRCDDKGNKPNG